MSPRKMPPVRYINPSCVDIGDLIRVAWSAGGIEHTRTARVYRKIREGGVEAFYTQEGTEIMHWIASADKKVRITLIEKAKAAESMLSLFEDSEIEVATRVVAKG